MLKEISCFAKNYLLVTVCEQLSFSVISKYRTFSTTFAAELQKLYYFKIFFNQKTKKQKHHDLDKLLARIVSFKKNQFTVNFWQRIVEISESLF